MLKLPRKISLKFNSHSSVKLICFGNAILDVGKRLNNKDLHDKYKLQLDDQLELDATSLQSLKKDLDEV